MSDILNRVSSNITASHSEQNVSDTERLVSVLGGGALTIYGLTRKHTSGAALAALGSALVWRGATGHCDVYHALGITTATEIVEPGPNVSVPYGKGIRVDRSITIGRAPSEVFRFWRSLENLPRFMTHLKSVTRIDDKRSHWVAKAPIGRIDWEAEIINEVENELIGWRSVEDSAIPNAGSVRFSPTFDGRATRVDVELQYDPPAGKIGAALARLFGEEPSLQIADDLRRLKRLLESGEVPMNESQPREER